MARQATNRPIRRRRQSASGSKKGASKALAPLLEKAARELPSITIDPQIQGGAPVVRGTRIAVHMILRAIEERGTLEGALQSYPDLSPDQIKDAVYYARVVLSQR